MTRWGRRLERIFLAAVALLFLVYGVDFAVYTLRGQPRNSFEVKQFLAVPLKGSKTELDYQGSTQTACARALFPRSGLTPCWYIARHQTRTITP